MRPAANTPENLARIRREMAALDSLPRNLRLLVKFGPFRANPIDVVNALRHGRPVDWCIGLLRSVWRATPNVRAQDWAKWNATAYPHTAADATLMSTEPIEAGTARSRLLARRRIARTRAPPPNPVRVPKPPPRPDVILL